MINLKEHIKEAAWRTRNALHVFRLKKNEFFEKIHLGFLVRAPKWMPEWLKKILQAFVYLIPAILLLGTFTFYPIFNSFIISF